MSRELARHKRAFLDYAEGFRTGDDQADFYLDLKAQHTLRVLGWAERICDEERFDEPTARLARLAALYHDAGRFLQYQLYGTFNDRESLSHARLGVRAIVRHGLLDDLDRADRRVIIQAVGLHNARFLPSALPAPLSTVVRTVRDSDKLDIFPVMLELLDESQPERPVVALGTIRHRTKYTEHIARTALARKSGSYQDMKWSNDFKILVASWVYDLNFAATARALKEKGYLATLLAQLPADELMDRLKIQLVGDLDGLCRKNT